MIDASSQFFMPVENEITLSVSEVSSYFNPDVDWSGRGDWGPHLIVVPTSVMLNWEMECKKWCPAFKLLTYFGSAKERKLKRHGWSKPNAFHICITSYTLVLQVCCLDHSQTRMNSTSYVSQDTGHTRQQVKLHGSHLYRLAKLLCKSYYFIGILI